MKINWIDVAVNALMLGVTLLALGAVAYAARPYLQALGWAE